MKDLILFCLLCLPSLLMIIVSKLKIRALKKKPWFGVLNRLFINEENYNTLIIQDIVNVVFRKPKAQQNILFQYLNQRQPSSFFQALGDRHVESLATLMHSPQQFPSLEKDTLYSLLQITWLLKNHRFDQASEALQKLPVIHKKSPFAAFKNLIIAQIALSEGDLLSASEETSKALNFFRKHNFLFEEAQTYFLLGTVYRVSGVFDSADFMLRSAVDLFRFVKASRYEAEVLGNLGLLMALQKRFDEAQSYFEQAKTAYKQTTNSDGEGFILCQQALMALQQENLKQAKDIAEHALAAYKNTQIQAFASDVLARLFLADGNSEKSAQYAQKATELYNENNNTDAAFECRYIQAEALVDAHQLDQAEQILRALIEDALQHPHCFYIGNAYTLLGLIMLETRQIKRAKSLFSKALEHELSNNRPTGIAIDCANLAVVNRLCGQDEEAKRQLHIAMETIKDVDDELYQQLSALAGYTKQPS
jgi:tetratricopeptide (TPR) repeat protein